MTQAANLFTAIEAGDTDGVRAMLAARPSLAAAGRADGLPAVLFALYRNQRPIVDALLAQRPELDLFSATALGDEARLATLLAGDAGAAGAFAADGFTSLHLAAFFGRVGAARRLLDAGADASAVARNSMRVQPLHSASAGGHRAICALLLARGADVNARQHGGWTPLHAAAQNGDTELAEMLLAAGADPGATDDDGHTAAALAADAGHAALAARLRADGA
jgi:ankyrin repeat protein